jgi:hypothetical protein
MAVVYRKYLYDRAVLVTYYEGAWEALVGDPVAGNFGNAACGAKRWRML